MTTLKSLLTLMILLTGAPLLAEDWVDHWNSGGELWAEAENAGSDSTWGEWVVTEVSAGYIGGMDFLITHLAFPCASPTGEPVEWVLWVTDGSGPPPGPPESAPHSGTFVPPLVDGSDPLPFSYVTIELDPWVPSWYYQHLVFGYRNPGFAGLTDFNGIESWTWYGGEWTSDSAFGQTAVLQIMGWVAIIPTEDSSWSGIKSLY